MKKNYIKERVMNTCVSKIELFGRTTKVYLKELKITHF